MGKNWLRRLKWLLRTIWSLILLIPIFRTYSSDYQGLWSWINSPWIFLLFLTVFVAILLLQLSGSKSSQKIFQETAEESIASNRMVNNEIAQLMNIETGKEVRLYQLENRLEDNQNKDLKTVDSFFKENLLCW